MNTKNIVLLVLLLILVAAVSFAAGARLQFFRSRILAGPRTGTYRQQFPGYFGRRGYGMPMMRSLGTAAQITNINGNQITVTLLNSTNSANLNPGQTVLIRGLK